MTDGTPAEAIRAMRSGLLAARSEATIVSDAASGTTRDAGRDVASEARFDGTCDSCGFSDAERETPVVAGDIADTPAPSEIAPDEPTTPDDLPGATAPPTVPAACGSLLVVFRVNRRSE
jgi:hypothetical protein